MADQRIYRTGSVQGRHSSKGLADDLAIMHGDFADYLRSRHYAPRTVEHYKRHMVRVACWLRDHPRYPALEELTRPIVARLLAHVLPHGSLETRMNYRKAMFHWLRFRGRYARPIARPWAPWLSDYLQFLRTHQGVSQSTLDLNRDNAVAFMEWQFGNDRAKWSRVQPADIWRFARHYVRGVKPTTAKSRLGYVRRFLSFVHLRGACGPQLAAAIPKIAQSGGPPRPQVLTPQQRDKLLACFVRSTPEGQRNYAMTLCMVDLGLRAGEVIGLRLPDIDWQGHRLTIRVTKTGRGRQLPLPRHVMEALRHYIKDGRPQNGLDDHLFLRHPRRGGYPLSRSALKGIIGQAYRHCGFPPGWWGTHRLRHTFASRLHQRGVDLKPIADLLGHRQLDSTNIYTQVDIEALRRLAKPWPWRV
jgi:site-specific recombinase XerD